MDITATKISDHRIVGDDSAKKIELADSLIESFSSVFFEDVEKKKQQLIQSSNDLKSLIEKLRLSISAVKEQKTRIRREQEKKKILDEISYLVNHDVLYGESKTKIKSFLLDLNKMNNQNIRNCTETIKKMKQKVQKVLK